MKRRFGCKLPPAVLAAVVLLIGASGCGKNPDEREALLGGWVEVKLTEDGALYPSWSPDGSLVAYCAQSYTSIMDLYSVPAKGGAPTQLTNISGLELYPSWNYNGPDKELVFVNASFISGSESPGHSRIYTGSFASRDLDIALESDSVLVFPTFTYDRAHIVYVNESASRGIWYIDYGNPGSVPQKINNSTGWGDVIFARASHSDDRIIYIEEKENAFNLMSIPFGGGEPVKLTNNPPGSTLFIHSADISYDGTMIIYDLSLSSTTNESRLYLASTEGGEPIPVTGTPDGIFHDPSWSPDNKRIAVNRKIGAAGSGDIYVVELDL